MVVALEADLDHSATPGLLEGGHEFYTVPGAFALRDVRAAFDGGHVVVGVASIGHPGRLIAGLDPERKVAVLRPPSRMCTRSGM